MGAGRCFAYIALSLVVCACNLRRPEVTLTLAPIETRTPEATKMAVLPTETMILRESPTRTATAKPSLTATDLPTVVPTETSTATYTPVPTDSNTPTPTASEIVIPTETHTSLPTVTDTVIPTETLTLPPTLTETAEPTETFTSAPTATYTARPTATFTPNSRAEPYSDSAKDAIIDRARDGNNDISAYCDVHGCARTRSFARSRLMRSQRPRAYAKLFPRP